LTRFRRSIVLAGLVLTLLLLGTSCWNAVELDRRALVMGVGIDKAKEEGKIALTVQIVKPGQLPTPRRAPGPGPPVWVVTSTGYTVFDAVRNFVLQSGRKLFWAHMVVIVISEEVAREGLAPVLDFFDRDAEPRRLSKVIIAKGIAAKEIMKGQHELETIPAAAIRDLVEGFTSVSTAVSVNLNEFLKRMSAGGVEPVAARIEVVAAEEREKAEEKALQSGDDGGMAEDPRLKAPPRFRVTGAAVFKGDRLAGWLNRPETRGYLWTQGKVVSGIVVLKCPQNEKETIGIELIRSEGEIKPRVQEGRVVAEVKVKAEAHVGDVLCPLDLTKPETLRLLEKRMNTVIENEVRAAFRKAQEGLRADIFGVGAALHRSSPGQWKKLKDRWDEVFPEVQVEIKADAKIRRVNLVLKPAQPK